MIEQFSTLGQEIAKHAQRQPEKLALLIDGQALAYKQLDAQMNRVAAAMRAAGLKAQDAISLCAAPSANYAVVFLAALRAGIAVAPLAPSCTPEQLSAMVNDSDARLLFVDAANREALAAFFPHFSKVLRVIDLEAELDAFCATATAVDCVAQPIQPEWAFNLIYSSGTTGVPKGIVQSHGMRWTHVQRATIGGYTQEAVTILATPLYSNTTLVSFFPSLALGGTVIVQPKFEAKAFLELAQRYRATHTILVPVIYKRLLAHPRFDSYDLSSFKAKFCTSAPLDAALKAEVLRRWPGGLTDSYGMTEGGAVVSLQAHLFPNKLHTVGRPVPGHEVRLLDDNGRDVGPGESGEIVGRSPGMMNGYHKLPQKTAEMEWFDENGARWFKTGDVGKFDEDGFLVLQDRKKDMIISGGFNVYPSDLEAVLREHPDVSDVAVVGVPSDEWGETPVAFVVPKAQSGASEAAELKSWANAKLAKTQRLAALYWIDQLPRSAIGKVLKRELRDGLATKHG